MSNPFTSIEIGGQTRTLRLGYGAIARIEAAFGNAPIQALMSPPGPSFSVLIETLLQSLNHHGQRQVSKDTLLKWLDEDPTKMVESYLPALNRVLTVALTGKEPEELGEEDSDSDPTNLPQEG